MKTLLCSQKPPLLFHFPKRSLSLHNPTQTILLHPTTTTAWLHANSKGFGGGGGATAKKSVTTAKYSYNDENNIDGDQLPQAVLDRIIVRIVVSVGLPLATGLFLMYLFGLVKEQQLWDVPVWVPSLSTFVTFSASAMGLAYGPISASWDEDRKGSLLGLEEFQKNWVEIWEEEEEDDDD
ncbi:hypothetical protein ACOSQ3_028042 [Xanthoceras sorbifolium]